MKKKFRNIKSKRRIDSSALLNPPSDAQIDFRLRICGTMVWIIARKYKYGLNTNLY